MSVPYGGSPSRKVLAACRTWNGPQRGASVKFMPVGTIKKLVPDRGFGFIAAEDGVEYFFYRTALDRSLNFEALQGGERVEFDIEPSQRGPRAARVRPPD